MADDAFQQLLQNESLRRASMQQGGGGKQGPLDGMIVKGAQSLSIAHGGGGFKLVGPFNGTGRGVAGGTADKFLAAIQAMGDGFLKSLANTGIQPAGNGDFSANISSGGSFAANIGPSNSGDIGLS